MPRRNKEQQEKHNEARRKLSKAGKKAMFSIQYVKTTQPKLVEEANNLYDFLYELYPGKHDLTKTEVYMNCVKKQDMKSKVLQCATGGRNTNEITKLQPVLNIPLMQMPPSSSSSSIPNETVHTEEIPLQLPILTDDETSKLIRDLQQDPDLKYYFQDDEINEVFVTTEKPVMETGPKTLESEIDQLIKDEFEALGADLPDITVNDELLLQ